MKHHLRRLSFFFAFISMALVATTRTVSAQDTQPGEATPLATDNATLDGWVRDVVEEVGSDRPGHWQFVVADRPVIVLTDEQAGRMRIITPIAELPDDPELLRRLMEANFDTALDARYAAWRGRLWSAFIHPLPTLTKEDFYSGVGQVVTLAATTGTTYSSSGLNFGGEPAAEPEGPAS
ncbi:MAG: type III secretion system chaperone [Planctomycetota bacterium]